MCKYTIETDRQLLTAILTAADPTLLVVGMTTQKNSAGLVTCRTNLIDLSLPKGAPNRIRSVGWRVTNWALASGLLTPNGKAPMVTTAADRLRITHSYGLNSVLLRAYANRLMVAGVKASDRALAGPIAEELITLFLEGGIQLATAPALKALKAVFS